MSVLPVKKVVKVMQGSEEVSTFIGVSEVCSIMGCSKATAYRIMKQLNEQLQKAGKITLHGKVNRRFFMQKIGADADV